MTAPSAALIARYTLRQIQVLADSHPEWLRPRWPARVQVWRELLLAAVSGEATALERARLRGVTLLAAEVRVASQSRSTLKETASLSAGDMPGMSVYGS
jgi:hypothetical protein